MESKTPITHSKVMSTQTNKIFMNIYTDSSGLVAPAGLGGGGGDDESC